MTWKMGGWKVVGVAAFGIAAVIGAAGAMQAAAGTGGPAASWTRWCPFWRPGAATRAGASAPVGGARGGYGWGYGSGPGTGPGMMGGYGNGYGYGMMGAYGAYAYSERSVPAARVAALGDSAPSGATVDPSANRVVFASRAVTLVVVASPSGQRDETFRIAGLVNPTVVVPVGAAVHLTLVNADTGMYHNLVVTPAGPPFSYMAMMQAPLAFPGAATPLMPPATTSASPSAATAFVAQAAGTYTYLCTYPGHARAGMYGRLIVRPS